MQVQNNNILLDICDKNIMLFPEWPTYKGSEEKENKHSFAKYKMEKNKEDMKKPSRYEPRYKWYKKRERLPKKWGLNLST